MRIWLITINFWAFIVRMSQWKIANNCFINRIVFILIFFVAYIFLNFHSLFSVCFPFTDFSSRFSAFTNRTRIWPSSKTLSNRRQIWISSNVSFLQCNTNSFYAFVILFVLFVWSLFGLWGKVFHFTIFTKCRRNITLHINEHNMMTIAYIWLCEQLDKLTFRTYDDDDDDEKLRLFQKNQIEFHLATG